PDGWRERRRSGEASILPRSGNAPRSEHDRIEGEQRRHRAPGRGDQGGSRAAPRTGGERRVTRAAEPLSGGVFPVIFAAPSGAGKTSIARALRDVRDDVEFSISATTRAPRIGERHG